MTATFWTYFGLYDGAVRCQSCNHAQKTESLTFHEDWCPVRDAANKWYYAEAARIYALKAETKPPEDAMKK